MSSIPASFNATVGGTLQAFLNQNSTGAVDTGLFGLLKTAGGGVNTTNLIGVLQGGTTSAASATATALASGGLKTNQQKVIAAIANAPNASLTEAWNSNGTEPTTLTTLRSYGWIKLTGRSFDASTKTTQGTYILTPVGNAINLRTNGGQVSASSSGALSSATLNGTSASSAASLSASQSAAIASILNALGFGSSSSSSSVAGVSSSSSSSTTGSVLSVLA